MTPTVRQALAQCGLVPVDAKALLAHVLGRNRAWLAAHETDALTQDEASAFTALCNRRRAGEPVAYLTGSREFWGLTLAVTPDVLIRGRKPRRWSNLRCRSCRAIVRCVCSTWARAPAPSRWRWRTNGPMQWCSRRTVRTRRSPLRAATRSASS